MNFASSVFMLGRLTDLRAQMEPNQEKLKKIDGSMTFQ